LYTKNGVNTLFGFHYLQRNICFIIKKENENNAEAEDKFGYPLETELE
jgi:hypothetical protein